MSRRINYKAMLAEEETEDPAGWRFPRRLRRCPRKASSRRSHQHVTILIHYLMLLS
ncbi:MAG: hypothetical protein LRY73_13710 [Bacillus sp. (in: Bacteria)]|nr:hypothetical protein [Bacillus sp. (in: firmicutes)]